jgi:hypothetical protein
MAEHMRMDRGPGQLVRMSLDSKDAFANDQTTRASGCYFRRRGQRQRNRSRDQRRDRCDDRMVDRTNVSAVLS